MRALGYLPKLSLLPFFRHHPGPAYRQQVTAHKLAVATVEIGAPVAALVL